MFDASKGYISPFTILLEQTMDWNLFFSSELEQLNHSTKKSLIFKHDMYFFLWNLSSHIICIVLTIPPGLGHF